MDCIDYDNSLYKEAEEFKNNLIQKVQKINNLALKNDEEINEIRKQCKLGLDKINDITQILNQHTEILTELKLLFLKIQKNR